MSLKIGELCAGYGGLGMAVEEVFGAELAWVSEFDDAPSKILAHHWPNVPNHGDMTKIDWAAIEPVDIISGGTPCQDLSHAGRRAGMNEGTRSNLWVQMREAIATIKPTYVVWENVRGAYSADADSDLESCPGCLGDAELSGTVLRALGRVLGDLSDLGYDCQWRGLRAADVGAPHGRFRVFILATLRAADDTSRIRRLEAIEHDGRGTATHDRAGVPNQSDRDALRVGSQRETHADTDDLRRERPRAARRRGHGPADGSASAAYTSGAAIGEYAGESLAEEARAADRHGPINHRGERPAVEWGPYEPAIRRWESTLGRRAPAPTEPTGRNAGHRLSARFAEWMMGVPDGWIVDVPGVSRNEALKAAGNGVVPQQAAAALRDILAHTQPMKGGEPNRLVQSR